MNTTTKLKLSASAILLALSSALPVHSQLTELESFTVTAQKYEQSAVDVPIAITAYDQNFLDTFQMDDLESLAAFVPNLEIQEQSPNNPGFVIRGITSDSGASNIEPRVSIFRDGVSISKSRGSYVELFDVERIEVLKGPQGTLFGRGAQIGAVHIIQNKPVETRSSGFKAAYGNFDEIRLEGYLNTPVANDLFVRVAGSYWRRDGVIENFAGGDLNGKKTKAGRASLAWIPNDDIRLDVILNLQEDNYPGTSFKSRTFAPPGGSTSPFTFAGLNRAEELRIDRFVGDITAIYENRLNADWTLTSITSYRTFDSYEEFDADGTLAYYLEFAEDAQGDQFSQEIRLNFDNGGKLVGFTGASYFWEDGSQRVPLRYDERSVFTVFAANQPLIGPDGFPLILSNLDPFTGRPLIQSYEETFTNFGETRAIEVFVDGTYAATERLSITAGLRLTYEDITSSFLVENNPVPFFLAPTTGNPSFLLAPSNGLIQGSDTFTSAVGRLVGSYNFTNDSNTFLSVSRGRRPNVINVDNDTFNVLSDEIVWSYEVGYKGIFAEGRLSLDANAFYYEYENFQTNVTELDNTGQLITETRDSGNATAKGFETALNWRAAEGAFFFFNLGYIDATFDDVDSNGNQQALAGNRFRLTPEWSYSIGAELTTEWREGVRFFVAPTYTWKSQFFFEEENQPGIEQDDYGLVNLAVGLRWGDGKYELSFYARNLSDEDYLIDAGNTGASFGIPTFIAGPPRLYGVRLQAQF